MIPYTSVIILLLLAHILGDFFLQPKDWVKRRNSHHLAARPLYFHALIHGTLSSAVLLISIQLWWILPVIVISHFFIDLLKSYLPKDQMRWFVMDQFLHLLVILIVIAISSQFPLLSFWRNAILNPYLLLYLITYLLVLNPASIFVSLFTKNWQKNIDTLKENSLKNAGMWIGYIERVLILTFIYTGHFEAIGFLLTAKSIFRFGDLKDKNGHGQMEYILIGTLLSFGIAISIGIIALRLL